MFSKFDIRNAIFRLTADRKYSFVILITMSLGLAVSLFLFSQVFVRSYSILPFADGDRFVYATRFEHDRIRLNGGLLNFDIHNISKRQTVLDDFAAFEDRRFTLSNPSFTVQIGGVATSSNFFKLANVKAILGRTLLPTDDDKNASPVVVIGYSTWERFFQKDNDLIGKIINVDGEPTTIVGVMPRGFNFPVNDDIWLSYVPLDLPTPDGAGWNAIIGKLKNGISIEQADEEFKRLAKDIEQDYPQQYAGKSIAVQPYTKAFAKPISLLIDIMSVVALSVLLMSCFSVVSLIVVRMLENSKEAAIKNALGISTKNIIIGPLLESFTLCFLAGLLGVVFCTFGINFAASSVLNNSGPFWWEMKMGLHVIVAAIVFTLFSWIFTGILPVYLALRKPSLSLLTGGKKGGGGNRTGPLMSSFISLQVSCAFVLMVFTGVCLASLYKIINADYGVKPEGYMTALVQPSAALYPDLSKRVDYFNKLEQQIMRLPSVESIAFAGALPGSYSYLSTYNGIDVDLSINNVSPQSIEIPISVNLFDTLNVQLLQGRSFVDADNESAEPVVIISEAVEKKISPNSSAIGKKIHLNPDKGGPLLTVVGVVPNLIYGPPISLYESNLDTLYRPMKQVMPSWARMTLTVKVKGNPYEVENELIKAARVIDSQVALTGLSSYENSLSSNGNDFRALVYNFMPAALLAFLMSALGIYAISARIILQRTNDIGVMKALGISDSRINRIFMLNTCKKLSLGILIGVVFFVSFIPSIISKLVVIDYTILALNSLVVVVILSCIVLVASYLPLIVVHKLTPQEAINKY